MAAVAPVAGTTSRATRHLGVVVGEDGEEFVRPTALAARAERRVGPVAIPPTAPELLLEYAFLVAGGLDQAALHNACTEGAVRGIAPHLLLIHAGALTAQRYLALLEAGLGEDVSHAQGRITEIVDAMWATPHRVGLAIAEVRARGNVALLLMPQQRDWSEPPETRRWRAEEAAYGLLRRQPEMCAGSRFATWQLVAAPVLPGLVAGGFAVMPDMTIAVLAALVTLPFLFIVGLRVLSLLVVMRLPRLRRAKPLPDAALPVYSVIVPLFREAEVVPGLIESLRRLDYPVAKLDILIVTESVDAETQAALRAVALPPHMRVLVVPDVAPRTKPKALNYALRQSHGAFVVIYDAEDDPQPDQLRRAQRMFHDGPDNLLCVQGRLAMYNSRPGWIAHQFMLEYAALFDAMLPALVRLGLPVPLGGTSNHFPRAALDALGGWDSWNVTEDADLGVRIARLGGKIAVLDSTTYEEAPDRLSIWIPQRTRWMKGFMQTWLVHMRRPKRLLADLGLPGFIGFNAFLGGIVLSALIHPIFLALLAWEAAHDRLLVVPDSALGSALMAFALFNLVGGYASGMLIAGLAATRRGLTGLLPHLVLMPFYWVLISFAAYRAVLQLATKPYLWEKTPHKARAAAKLPPH